MNFKKLSLRALGLLMSVTLAACVLSSCSKDGSSDKLVESIPSSAMFVVKLNPQQVIENAGCSVDNGKIVLSPEISNVIKNEGGKAALKVVNEYLGYTEGLNLDAIMVFATKDDGSDLAVVATVKDEKPVKEHLKELIGKEKEEDGFTIYKFDGSGVIALKNNMLWVAQKLSVITNHIENAKESNITSINGISEVLTADNAFAYVVALPKISSNLKKEGIDIKRGLVRDGVPSAMASKIVDVMDYYLCGSLTLADNTISGEAFLVDEKGQRYQFGKLFNPIDTDFLNNIPADANFVAACGSIADADVKALINDAANEIARDSRDAETGQLLRNLLTKWDGTAAAAFDYNYLMHTDFESLLSMSERTMMETMMEHLKFIFMVHYPQSVINNLTGKLCDQAGLYREVGTGYYQIDVTSDMAINFGNLNGYFAVSNFNDDKGARSLADKFSGKRLAIYSRTDAIPALAQFGFDFGTEGELWLDDDAVKFSAKLTDTKLKYLQAIIEPFTDVDNLEKMMKYVRELERSSYNYYGYDYDDYYGDFYGEPVAAEEDYDYDEDYLYDI